MTKIKESAIYSVRHVHCQKHFPQSLIIEIISQNIATSILLSFSITDMCETVFSALAHMKKKSGTRPDVWGDSHRGATIKSSFVWILQIFYDIRWYHTKVVTFVGQESGYFVGWTMRCFRKSPQLKSALINSQAFEPGPKTWAPIFTNSEVNMNTAAVPNNVLCLQNVFKRYTHNIMLRASLRHFCSSVVRLKKTMSETYSRSG